MYKYQRIRDLREDRELNQTEIAQVLGTTQTQYSRWERGAQEIPVHVLMQLALYYKRSMDYLTGLPEGLPYSESKTKRK